MVSTGYLFNLGLHSAAGAQALRFLFLICRAGHRNFNIKQGISQNEQE